MNFRFKRTKNNLEASDAEVVSRVQQGDVQAYNILVSRYQHKVLEIAGRYAANSADAGDIAQEAFIKAYRAIGNFRGDSAFYTWLYRITVNVAKTYLAGRAKFGHTLDVDAPEFESQDTQGVLTSRDSPDKFIESDELKRAIKAAFDQLPPGLRQAVYLREIEGLAYEEIAKILKIPVGTVRSRIFRGRQVIEAAIAELTAD